MSQLSPSTLGTNEKNIQESFETVSRNLRAYNVIEIIREGGKLKSLVYQAPQGQITKTLNRTTINEKQVLTSITLSGSTPENISLVKNFLRDNQALWIGTAYGALT
jgi:hypothetical protein